MMGKSAAFDAGVQSELEKDANVITRGLGAVGRGAGRARAAVNKSVANVAGAVGARGSGRVHQIADRVAVQGRQQAARSMQGVRASKNKAKRVATTQGHKNEMMQGAMANAKTPAERVIARSEVNQAHGRMMAKAKAGPNAPKPAAAAPAAPAPVPDKKKGLLSSPAARYGAAALGGAGLLAGGMAVAKNSGGGGGVG